MTVKNAIELLKFEANLTLQYADTLEKLPPLLQRFDGKSVNCRISQYIYDQIEPACHVVVAKDGNMFEIRLSAKEPSTKIDGNLYYASNRSHWIKCLDAVQNNRLVYVKAAETIAAELEEMRSEANTILTLQFDSLFAEYEAIKSQIEAYQQRIPYTVRDRMNLDFEAKFDGYCQG